MIAPMGLEHVEQVARLHCAALTGLLSGLGESAAKAYYTGCVRAGSAVGFVYLKEGAVRGFVLGSIHPDRLKHEAVRSNPAGTLAGVLLGVLRRPAALAWLVKSFKGPAGSFDPSCPELTYLAVSGVHQKTGIGGSLVDAFTRAMRDAGAAAYDLSVDDGNERAIAFYEGRGFEPIGRYREFSSMHRRYRLRLSSLPAR